MSDLFGMILCGVVLYVFYTRICKEMIKIEKDKHLKEIETLEQERRKNAKMEEYLDLLIEDKQDENRYRSELKKIVFEEN